MATEPHFERDRNEPRHLGSSVPYNEVYHNGDDGSSLHVASPDSSSQSLGGKVRQSNSASPISFAPTFPLLRITAYHSTPRPMSRTARKNRNSPSSAGAPASARIESHHRHKPQIPKTTHRVSKKRKLKSRSLAYPGIKPSKFPSASTDHALGQHTIMVPALADVAALVDALLRKDTNAAREFREVVNKMYANDTFPDSVSDDERRWYQEVKEHLRKFGIAGSITFKSLYPSLRQSIIESIKSVFPGGSFHNSCLPAQLVLEIEEHELNEITVENGRMWDDGTIPLHLQEYKNLYPGKIVDPEMPPPVEVVRAIRFLEHRSLPGSLLGEWQYPLPSAELRDEQRDFVNKNQSADPLMWDPVAFHRSIESQLNIITTSQALSTVAVSQLKRRPATPEQKEDDGDTVFTCSRCHHPVGVHKRVGMGPVRASNKFEEYDGKLLTIIQCPLPSEPLMHPLSDPIHSSHQALAKLGPQVVHDDVLRNHKIIPEKVPLHELLKKVDEEWRGVWKETAKPSVARPLRKEPNLEDSSSGDIFSDDPLPATLFQSRTMDRLTADVNSHPVEIVEKGAQPQNHRFVPRRPISFWAPGRTQSQRHQQPGVTWPSSRIAATVRPDIHQPPSSRRIELSPDATRRYAEHLRSIPRPIMPGTPDLNLEPRMTRAEQQIAWMMQHRENFQRRRSPPTIDPRTMPAVGTFTVPTTHRSSSLTQTPSANKNGVRSAQRAQQPLPGTRKQLPSTQRSSPAIQGGIGRLRNGQGGEYLPDGQQAVAQRKNQEASSVPNKLHAGATSPGMQNPQALSSPSLPSPSLQVSGSIPNGQTRNPFQAGRSTDAPRPRVQTASDALNPNAQGPRLTIMGRLPDGRLVGQYPDGQRVFSSETYQGAIPLPILPHSNAHNFPSNGHLVGLVQRNPQFLSPQRQSPLHNASSATDPTDRMNGGLAVQPPVRPELDQRRAGSGQPAMPATQKTPRAKAKSTKENKGNWDQHDTSVPHKKRKTESGLESVSQHGLRQMPAQNPTSIPIRMQKQSMPQQMPVQHPNSIAASMHNQSRAHQAPMQNAKSGSTGTQIQSRPQQIPVQIPKILPAGSQNAFPVPDIISPSIRLMPNQDTGNISIHNQHQPRPQQMPGQGLPSMLTGAQNRPRTLSGSGLLTRRMPGVDTNSMQIQLPNGVAVDPYTVPTSMQNQLRPQPMQLQDPNSLPMRTQNGPHVVDGLGVLARDVPVKHDSTLPRPDAQVTQDKQ